MTQKEKYPIVKSYLKENGYRFVPIEIPVCGKLREVAVYLPESNIAVPEGDWYIGDLKKRYPWFRYYQLWWHTDVSSCLNDIVTQSGR